MDEGKSIEFCGFCLILNLVFVVLKIFDILETDSAILS